MRFTLTAIVAVFAATTLAAPAAVPATPVQQVEERAAWGWGSWPTAHPTFAPQPWKPWPTQSVAFPHPTGGFPGGPGGPPHYGGWRAKERDVEVLQ